MVRIFELNAQYGCFSDRLAYGLLTILNLSLFLQPLDFEQTLWNWCHASDFVLGLLQFSVFSNIRLKLVNNR